MPGISSKAFFLVGGVIGTSSARAPLACVCAHVALAERFRAWECRNSTPRGCVAPANASADANGKQANVVTLHAGIWLGKLHAQPQPCVPAEATLRWEVYAAVSGPHCFCSVSLFCFGHEGKHQCYCLRAAACWEGNRAIWAR